VNKLLESSNILICRVLIIVFLFFFLDNVGFRLMLNIFGNEVVATIATPMSYVAQTRQR